LEEMNQALKDVDVYIEISWSNNWSTNMTGHPIVVVPCGFLDSGRPVTVTFVGQLFKEAKLLAVAKAFQDATDFHLRHPDL
jgi:Asp-tRNA(Asn)/Glu-tRNA(Gln) amidotransferase A subunit family amidase